jgi:hypothetical protein
MFMTEWEFAAIVCHHDGCYLVRANMRSKQAYSWSYGETHPSFSGTVLYRAKDVLQLISKAGRDGWEITGGIGKGDSSHPEQRWRMMRREI